MLTHGPPAGLTLSFQKGSEPSTAGTDIMKNQLHNLALAAFALWLCGCASSSIKESWKSPAYQGGPVQKISVLAVDERDLVRMAFENRFVREMRGHGQNAMATHELLGLPEIKADQEAAAARVRTAGADAILIVRLMDQSTYSRQVQATPALFVSTVTGYESYGWYDCYSVAYTDMGVVWSSTKQNIYLDTSLFDLKTGQRLWSALTLTVLKENEDRLVVADALVAKLVSALRKDGLIH
jgi:hypothetical protein